MQNSASIPESTFVTVLAWIFIVFGGFGVFGSLMQNIMINLMMPAFFKSQAATDQPVPPFPIGIFRAFGIFFLLFVSFVTYAAYALLRRRNWARRTFVVLFALGIVVNVVWAIGFGLGAGFSSFPTTGENAAPPGMRAMFTAMAAMFAVFALAISFLFGWLIKRLRSTSVKAEFGNGAVVT